MLRLEGCVIRAGEFELRADLAVQKGRRVAVIGPSGGGKTTLLEAVAGFIRPVEGRITWEGRDLGPLAPGARPVAMLFQEGNLFPHLTAAQNVGLGLAPRLAMAGDARVTQALGRVGLAGLERRQPSEMSGGQRARVALARVLVQRRDLLLLDEPFAALGPALRAEMLDMVADLAAETGATVLMVSHHPDDARRIADEVIVVAEGRAAPPVETRALFADPPPVLRRYLG
ncbi:ATP-binding cassette domain-containing protein [Roseovarius sp. SCSIO 43702]|uniref:thiamine ABC transporter ATP-binding protein n=1 Tax=Roseovarius sp. SCSIO 43702 TaxID=2823043 RepID=UPI001C732DFE|nr:ATP-binding cassette domain-containing protein [Roseovarius sp. SCSIO 43702]QYX57484.1 ATP-binding cassette domain-containing protein [Roseovarius sp. SCSIO 43702]